MAVPNDRVPFVEGLTKVTTGVFVDCTRNAKLTKIFYSVCVVSPFFDGLSGMDDSLSVDMTFSVTVSMTVAVAVAVAVRAVTVSRVRAAVTVAVVAVTNDLLSDSADHSVAASLLMGRAVLVGGLTEAAARVGDGLVTIVDILYMSATGVLDNAKLLDNLGSLGDDLSIVSMAAVTVAVTVLIVGVTRKLVSDGTSSSSSADDTCRSAAAVGAAVTMFDPLLDVGLLGDTVPSKLIIPVARVAVGLVEVLVSLAGVDTVINMCDVPNTMSVRVLADTFSPLLNPFTSGVDQGVSMFIVPLPAPVTSMMDRPSRETSNSSGGSSLHLHAIMTTGFF